MSGSKRKAPPRGKRGTPGRASTSRGLRGARPRRSLATREAIFGHYSKVEAEQLYRLLEDAGIPGTLDLDKELSRQHKAAASINPAIRRARSFRDVKMGYFVRVPAAHREAALAAVEGTAFTLAGDVRAEGAQAGGGLDGRPDFDADPRYCDACDRELPPHTKKCPECGGETLDILQREEQTGIARLPWWVILILALVAAALIVLRILA